MHFMLIFTICALLVFQSYNSNKTGRILNPLIQVVSFPNDPCTGSSTSLLGTCFSPPECNAKTGSLADGKCASGFGVCCVVRVNGCGGSIINNNTHLENTGYPDKYTEANTCTYNLDKISPDICFIRLDFVNFVLDGPVSAVSPNWDCSNDKLVFTTPSSRAPPEICGYNTDQHLYLDASYQLQVSPVMVITTTGTTFERTWQIRVDQIKCGTLYTPPHGCIQYQHGVSGRFRSFNFGLDNDYHHLNKQDYAICFRRELGYCIISYTAADDEGDSFYLSGHPNNPSTNAKAGETGCVADFITIPRGTNGGAGASCANSGATADNLGRFCGRRLSCAKDSDVNAIVYSDVVPFQIHVELNEAEPITQPAANNKNRGFSVDYRQLLC